ncbi:hypothetical protein [Fictibacillus sp. FJAT-27399]|uniref:hypothetical protein n=1 Tax=Fictibacillus sp. FJAT-27399 TaxID=1729689 RepID=UPI000782A86C|nr:hypothetical protein [Fictibacillus sp. FJAT-27399]
MRMNGNIISGEFDEGMNEFSLQQVKHLTTQSTLSVSQLNKLYGYLQKHQSDLDGQVITLYDAMPIRLSQEEIGLLLQDLGNIQSLYQQ